MLEACAGAWAASGGAFDPTIQPLWRLYAQHFSSTDADPAGPTAVDLEEARSLVGFDAVLYNPDRIAFARRGMALTLNGIAQGFVTDAVVRLLRAEGITRSLVSMGESRAIGTAGDGRPWRVGLAEMEAGSKPDVVVELVDRAVATSSLSGFRFDSAGRFNHILDPKQGAIPQIYRRVSVIAPDATTADAFSTAFSLLDQTTIRTIVTKNPGMVVDLLDNKGVHMRV
jgi:thiamine biosynthesis lipoprotein